MTNLNTNTSQYKHMCVYISKYLVVGICDPRTATNPTEYLGFPATNSIDRISRFPFAPRFPATICCRQKLYEESSIIMSTNAASAVGIISSDGQALTTSAIVAEAVTGSYVLQIKGYSRTKGLGNGKCIKSSMFSVGGHHWYIKFYPDGDRVENADWIAIFLQHDHTDAVDVKARYKFGVLDYSGESVPTFSQETSVDDTFSSKNPSWGFSKFVKRKDLEESSYLKDDCLKVSCDVIISNGISTEPTMQFVVVPLSNIHRHLGSLLSGAVGADVTYEVAGEMFAAHRSVLAARSSVFMAELFGPMKEKTMNCIQIQDMEARVFKAMLHFI